MDIKLKPFVIPSVVIGEIPRPSSEPFTNLSLYLVSYPLKDIDPKDLSRLCDQFRVEVFKAAGKTDPNPNIYFRK